MKGERRFLHGIPSNQQWWTVVFSVPTSSGWSVPLLISIVLWWSENRVHDTVT